MIAVDASVLDNPVWESLIGEHSGLARRSGDALWYGASYTPFVAVESAAARVEGGTGLAGRRYFLGVAPALLPGRWRRVPRDAYHASPDTLQFLRGLDEPDLAARRLPVTVLGREHRASMLVLASEVYPEFFREDTADLGTYVGILRGDRVVAMAGERMAVPGAREISAVCTHPDFAAQGMASALVAGLVKRHRAAGLASFLHVSGDNPGARRLYERLGFIHRATLTLTAVEITAS